MISTNHPQFQVVRYMNWIFPDVHLVPILTHTSILDLSADKWSLIITTNGNDLAPPLEYASESAPVVACIHSLSVRPN